MAGPGPGSVDPDLRADDYQSETGVDTTDEDPAAPRPICPGRRSGRPVANNITVPMLPSRPRLPYRC